ncbi:uncharacterized protein LOC129874087 [Solanum dulcamara]|uniref:uncharacterized protein LOC129874087 n=1 Tax=Solanum dulcamara TaxID=45834 RepID=UPI002484F502|nr:uncharacterized protein LOC129874087 [Solanum dulcamara]
MERIRSSSEKIKIMNQNISSFLIGIVGATFTLGAYSQTWMTPTQSITMGLVTLMFGLLVREGFISL